MTSNPVRNQIAAHPTVLQTGFLSPAVFFEMVAGLHHQHNQRWLSIGMEIKHALIWDLHSQGMTAFFALF